MPRALCLAFLELIHADAAAHLKLAKSLAHLQRRAWWLEWRKDMDIFIKNCGKCEAYHRGGPPKQALLKPMVFGAPSKRWSIDLIGPFAVSDGYKLVFTAIDVFTKFVVAVPIRNKEAPTVAKAIVERIFLPWGLGTQLLSDCGKVFENELLSEISRLLGVHKLKMSGYRPQTNGSIERWHRVFNAILAKVVSEQQTDWSSYVAYVVACYNATTHSATGYASFFLMTGRDPKWSVDLLLSGDENDDCTLLEYVRDVRERLLTAHNLARVNLQAAAASAAEWYDKTARCVEFCVGDKVRLYSPRHFKGRSPKLQSNYAQIGTVVERLNDSTYVVQTKSGKKIFHTDKLKLIGPYCSDH